MRVLSGLTIKVNGKGQNLTRRHPSTPQPIVTKFCVGDYVGISTIK